MIEKDYKILKNRIEGERYKNLIELAEKQLKYLKGVKKTSFLKNPFERLREEYKLYKTERELSKFRRQYEKYMKSELIKTEEEKEEEKKNIDRKIKKYYKMREEKIKEINEREKRQKKIKEYYKIREEKMKEIRENLERKKDKFEKIREEKDVVKEQERAALDEFREMYEDKKHGAGSGSIKEMISDLIGKLGGSESEFWRAFNYFKYNHAGVYSSDEMLLIAAEVSKNKFSTMEEMADYIEKNWIKDDYTAGLDEFEKL